MTRYDHAYTVAFSLTSNHPTGEDVTADQAYTALRARIKGLMENEEMLEAIGAPYDTYEDCREEERS